MVGSIYGRTAAFKVMETRSEGYEYIAPKKNVWEWCEKTRIWI